MFDIQEELKKLPGKPGVYLMHDETDKIIYVGKAISLKNTLLVGATAILVSCGGQKEIKMGRGYDIPFNKDFGVVYILSNKGRKALKNILMK